MPAPTSSTALRRCSCCSSSPRCFGAVNFDWSLLANIAAILGGIAVLILAAALVNRARGRSALSVPDQLGKTELAAFVLIPALLPLIFGGQVESAVWTAAGNVGVLAADLGGPRLGLPSIVSWVFRAPALAS